MPSVFFSKILMVARFKCTPLFQLFLCERILEQEGVYGHVAIREVALDLIQLGKDLLSLEFPDFFTSYFLVRGKIH